MKCHHYLCKVLGILAQSIVIQVKTKKKLMLLKSDFVFVLWQLFILTFNLIYYVIYLKTSTSENVWMLRGFKTTDFDILSYYVFFAAVVILQIVIMLYFYFVHGRISYILNKSDELDNMMFRIKICTDYNSSIKLCFLLNLYYFAVNIIIGYFHYVFAEKNFVLAINYFLTNCITNAMVCYMTTLFHDIKTKFKAINLYFSTEFFSRSHNQTKNIPSKDLELELQEVVLIFKELNIYAKFVKDTFGFILCLLIMVNFWSFVASIYYSTVCIIQENNWNEMKNVIILGFCWNTSNATRIIFVSKNLIESTFEVSDIFFRHTNVHSLKKMCTIMMHIICAD